MFSHLCHSAYLMLLCFLHWQCLVENAISFSEGRIRRKGCWCLSMYPLYIYSNWLTRGQHHCGQRYVGDRGLRVEAGADTDFFYIYVRWHCSLGISNALHQSAQVSSEDCRLRINLKMSLMPLCMCAYMCYFIVLYDVLVKITFVVVVI